MIRLILKAHTRAGLVAKKVQVNRKGKTHTQTVYVRGSDKPKGGRKDYEVGSKIFLPSGEEVTISSKTGRQYMYRDEHGAVQGVDKDDVHSETKTRELNTKADINELQKQIDRLDDDYQSAFDEMEGTDDADKADKISAKIKKITDKRLELKKQLKAMKNKAGG